MQNVTRRQFFAIAAAIIATAAAPAPAEAAPAEAIPYKFRKCPSVEQNGVTYLLYQRCAIVTATPNRRTITIPHSIKTGGKRYTVRSIWDRTFEMCPKLRRVNLKARDLEAIEDPRIFDDHRVKVVCYDRSTWKWLHREGVNAVCKR